MNYYELKLLNIKLIYFIKSISENNMNEWHIMIFENVTQLKIIFYSYNFIDNSVL